MTEEEFNDLVDKYLAGKASPEEKRLIDSFFTDHDRKGDPHRERIRSKKMWSTFQAWLQSEVHAQKKPDRLVFFQRRAVYLVLLLLAASSFFLVYRSGLLDKKPRQITQTSARGQRLIITLSDGSVVRMNSASVISYPEKFASGKREIVLTGEAFFEVTPDAERPFVVRTDDLTTTVLGTRFNVQAFPSQNIRVTVETGKVQLTANQGNHTPAILTGGFQGVFDPVQKHITTSEVDLDFFLAWKNDVLKFEDSPLEEVTTILERWYDVRIKFENEKIKQCRINGQYKDHTLREVLESIQYMYKIDYKVTNQKDVLLYGQGCK